MKLALVLYVAIGVAHALSDRAAHERSALGNIVLLVLFWPVSLLVGWYFERSPPQDDYPPE